MTVTYTLREGACPTDLPHPRRANWIWRSCQRLLQNLFVFWIDYRAQGHDRLPSGGALLLANHESFLDPLLVGLPLQRPVSYLARHSLFPVPVLGGLLRRTYVLPINREAAGTGSLREAARRLRHGFYVGVFPEGTRTSGGRLAELKPGFISLLRHSEVPVVPVGIAGGGAVLPRGAAVLRPGRVRVVFGEPLEWSRVAPLTRRGCEQELLELVRVQLLACRCAARRWRNQTAADR